jgi:hypothetical protein
MDEARARADVDNTHDRDIWRNVGETDIGADAMGKSWHRDAHVAFHNYVENLSPLYPAGEAAYQSGSSAETAPPGYTIYPARKVWFLAATEPPQEFSRSFHRNHPNTLYGGVKIPDEDWDGMPYSEVFQLDGDDVIAIYGVTPPQITYYSFTMNEMAEYSETLGDYTETSSSIGLSINQANIGTLLGKQFNDFFVLLIAADFGAAELIRNWFLTSGVPEDAINVLYVPNRFTRQGSVTPSYLCLLTRLTFRNEGEKRTIFDYIERNPPPISGLFFDGPGGAGDVEDDDLMKWEDTLRSDDSEWDAGMDAQLEILVERVREHYEASGLVVAKEGRENLFHAVSERCRQFQFACHFDAPDAVYTQTLCQTGNGEALEPCQWVLPNDQDLIAIAGIYHHRFGGGDLATYFSYAATRRVDKQGVAAVVDVEFAGSAVPFLEDIPGIEPSDFFVITISRDCGDNESTCIKVPYPSPGSGVPGVPRLSSFGIATRVYLDKITGSAPNPESLVPARLLLFEAP